MTHRTMSKRSYHRATSSSLHRQREQIHIFNKWIQRQIYSSDSDYNEVANEILLEFESVFTAAEIQAKQDLTGTSHRV